MIYPYAQVSTGDRSVNAQVKQLRAAGTENVFWETANGTKNGRAQLRRVPGQLAKGGVLTVARLDRLACSSRDVLNTLATIGAKGVGHSFAA